MISWETITDIGADYGVDRANINENAKFTTSLVMNTQEIMTVVIIALFILFVSIVVIYSIFYISVMSRIRQFGQLRTPWRYAETAQETRQKRGHDHVPHRRAHRPASGKFVRLVHGAGGLALDQYHQRSLRHTGGRFFYHYDLCQKAGEDCRLHLTH